MKRVDPEKIERVCMDIYDIFVKHQPSSAETVAILAIVKNTHDINTIRDLKL